MSKHAENTAPGKPPLEVRIDKWLFAVRLFKTRSLAGKAIAGGKIKMDGHNVKAHRTLNMGDEIEFKRDGRTVRVTVKGLIENRVGAKEAVKHYTIVEDPDLTPEMREMTQIYRELQKESPRQRGRPTKRDRRQIQRLKEGDH